MLALADCPDAMKPLRVDSLTIGLVWGKQRLGLMMITVGATELQCATQLLISEKHEQRTKSSHQCGGGGLRCKGNLDPGVLVLFFFWFLSSSTVVTQ